MALTSDVERVEVAKEALAQEAAEKQAIDAMGDTGGQFAEDLHEPAGQPAPRGRQGPLVDPNLGYKSDEELIQGRDRLTQILGDPPEGGEASDQYDAFQDLLMRINQEIENREIQL